MKANRNCTLIFLVGFVLASNSYLAQNINTFAGQADSMPLGNGDGGYAITAYIGGIRALAKDGSGNIYIAPISGDIRKVNPSGIITTIAGTGIGACHGIAVDGAGNLYFSDQSTHKIRKVTTSGVISTYVGTGAMGFSGDGGPAISAKLNNPIGICVDAVGNLYIADGNNHRIRKVNTSGIITTIAGTGVGGFAGEGGPATLANMSVPEGITVDASGNVYFSDANALVRKITTSGLMIRVAGNTVLGFSGDGGLATSAQISTKAVAVDGHGNLYLAEYMYNVVRIVKPSGIISTIAGQDGLSGFSGDGGNPLSALLSYPYGLLVDVSCNLYISDLNNSRVRIITGSGCYVGINELKNNNNYRVSPNPSSGQFTFDGLKDKDQVEVFDLTGRLINSDISHNRTYTIDLGSKGVGLYFYRVTDDHKYVQQGKLIIE